MKKSLLILCACMFLYNQNIKADVATPALNVGLVNVGYADSSVFLPISTAAIGAGSLNCPNKFGYWAIGASDPGSSVDGAKAVAKAILLAKVTGQKIILTISASYCKNGYSRVDAVQLQ